MALAPEPPPDDLGPTRPAPPRSWRERVELIADATGTTPGRMLLGAGLVVLAVLGGLWLTRPPGDPVEVSLPYASSTSTPEPSGTEVPPGPQVVVVHVAGAVARPGVYELAAGARVVDAVTAAGGVTLEADEVRLNLAAPVGDGERVYVPKAGEEVPVDGAGSSPQAKGAAPSGPLDLNTADESALDDLPGVGPATAAAIIEHRERIGRFTSVEQLMDVRGIGEAKLEALRDLVRV